MGDSTSDYCDFEEELFAQEVAERSVSVDRRGELPFGCHHVFTPGSEGDQDPEFNPEAELAIINARIAELAQS